MKTDFLSINFLKRLLSSCIVSVSLVFSKISFFFTKKQCERKTKMDAACSVYMNSGQVERGINVDYVK